MSAKRAKKGRDCQSVKTRQRQGTAGIVRALKHARASQRVNTRTCIISNGFKYVPSGFSFIIRF